MSDETQVTITVRPTVTGGFTWALTDAGGQAYQGGPMGFSDAATAKAQAEDFAKRLASKETYVFDPEVTE